MNKAKLFYFVYYAAAAALTPFLTLYYNSLGLSGGQIGLLVGVVPLVGIVSSAFWSATADATRRYRPILLLAIAGTWLGVFFMLRATGLAGLLPAVLLYAIAAAPVAPLIDGSVVAQLGERRAEYGRVRLWGSVGWGLSALAIGPVLERAGLVWAFYAYLALMVVVFALSFGLPLGGGERQMQYGAALRVLLAERGYRLLLLVTLVYGMSLAMVLSFLLLHMQSLGAGETLMAVTLTVATVSEVPFLFLSGRLIRRFGVNRIIALALLITAARTLAYAWMPAPGWVIGINLFHGPTFALFWAAGVAEANRLAPPGLSATAQGLFSSTMFGLGSGLGNLIGGVIFARYGAPALFQGVAWLLLGTLVVFVWLRRRAARPALLAAEGQN